MKGVFPSLDFYHTNFSNPENLSGEKAALRGCCLKADVIPDWENMKPRGSTRLKTGMVLTKKLWSGTAAEARMDETIIFKLFPLRGKNAVWIWCLMHRSCLVMEQNESCPASCTNTCCTTDFCSTFLWKEQSQGWDILTHLIWFMSVQSSICLELEDTLPASFTERMTSLRWALQPWEAGFHSKFSCSLTAEFLLATAASFFSGWGSAFSLQLQCTEGLTSVLSQTVVLQSLLWAVSRDTSKAKKILFFSKNAKYNRACSARELQEHLAGEDGTLLLSGIT